MKRANIVLEYLKKISITPAMSCHRLEICIYAPGGAQWDGILSVLMRKDSVHVDRK